MGGGFRPFAENFARRRRVNMRDPTPVRTVRLVDTQSERDGPANGVRASGLPRRLDKFVRDASSLSYDAIRRAWSDGRIRVLPGVSGAAPRPGVDLNQLIYPEDAVHLDGQRLSLRTEHHTVKLNKPSGVTSTSRDPLGGPDLRPWLEQLPGAFAVGRLDRETTGLLLLSTDGELADAILQPARHVDKKYWLWLDDELLDGDARWAAMTQPSPLYDAAKHVELLHRSPDHTEVEMTLDQGKHRQIRKLCRALGLHLQHLHRRAIGPITLEGQSVGECVPLTPVEVDALWASVGGRERTWRAQRAALHRQAQKARDRDCPDRRLEDWLLRNPAPE